MGTHAKSGIRWKYPLPIKQRITQIKHLKIQYCMSSFQCIEIDSGWLGFIEKQHQTACAQKESKDIIHKDDFEASSMFEVLHVLLWVQAFFFHLRTTYFSWIISSVKLH